MERPTPRARYAIQEVLGTMLGWEVLWVDGLEELGRQEGPKLLYGRGHVRGAFLVRPAGLLEEEGVRGSDPGVIVRNGLPLLFPIEGGHLPFDPFSAAFFLLTRYEELAGVKRDVHGRPVAQALHGGRHAYLRRPVVDEWALLLASEWAAMDRALPDPVRTYRAVQTVDLDNGFKYLGRPPWRTVGALARDVLRMEWEEVPRRMRVLAGSEPDPFDIYRDLERVLAPLADRVLFFVLAGERGRHDHAVPLSDRSYADRLRGLSAWAEVGVHPSYHSSDRPWLIARETEALGAVIGRPVTLTRQHFLRMRLPDTYREVERLGMKEEHGMGFHEEPGFRAGTCTPYTWYDVPAERTTDLRVHPFTVMDNTLGNKLRLAPGRAIEVAGELIGRVKAVNGTFTGLWHESFLAHGEKARPWREAILRIIQLARP